MSAVQRLGSEKDLQALIPSTGLARQSSDRALRRQASLQALQASKPKPAEPQQKKQKKLKIDSNREREERRQRRLRYLKMLLVLLLGLIVFLIVWFTRERPPNVHVHTNAQGVKIATRTRKGRFEFYAHGEWETAFVAAVDLNSEFTGWDFSAKFANEEDLLFTKGPYRSDYRRWLAYATELNANVIKVPHLMPPMFYSVLAQHNLGLSSRRSLRLLQGIGVPPDTFIDRATGTGLDIIKDGRVNTLFKTEIDRVVHALHGNLTMYVDDTDVVTDVYDKDVSPLIAGIMLECDYVPGSVYATNLLNRLMLVHQGHYVQAVEQKASPYFNFYVRLLDYLAERSMKDYNMQMPIGLQLPATKTITDSAGYYAWNPLEMRSTVEWFAGVFLLDTNSYCPAIVDPNFIPDDPDVALDTYHHPHGIIRALELGWTVVCQLTQTSSQGLAGSVFWNKHQTTVYDEKDRAEQMERAIYNTHNKSLGGVVVHELLDHWQQAFGTTLLTTNYSRLNKWPNVMGTDAMQGLVALEPKYKMTVDGFLDDWEEARGVMTEHSMDMNVTMQVTSSASYVYLSFEKTEPNDVWTFDNDTLLLAFDSIPGGAYFMAGTDLTFGASAEYIIQFNSASDVQMLVNSEYDIHDYLSAERLPLDQYPISFPVSSSLGPQLPSRLPGSKGIFQKAKQRLSWFPEEIVDTGRLRRGVTTDPFAPNYSSIAHYAIRGAVLELRLPWAMLGFSDPSTQTVYGYQPANARALERPSLSSLQTARCDRLRIEFSYFGPNGRSSNISKVDFKWEDDWDPQVACERRKKGFSAVREAFLDIAHPFEKHEDNERREDDPSEVHCIQQTKQLTLLDIISICAFGLSVLYVPVVYVVRKVIDYKVVSQEKQKLKLIIENLVNRLNSENDVERTLDALDGLEDVALKDPEVRLLIVMQSAVAVLINKLKHSSRAVQFRSAGVLLLLAETAVEKTYRKAMDVVMAPAIILLQSTMSDSHDLMCSYTHIKRVCKAADLVLCLATTSDGTTIPGEMQAQCVEKGLVVPLVHWMGFDGPEFRTLHMKAKQALRTFGTLDEILVAMVKVLISMLDCGLEGQQFLGAIRVVRFLYKLGGSKLLREWDNVGMNTVVEEMFDALDHENIRVQRCAAKVLYALSMGEENRAELDVLYERVTQLLSTDFQEEGNEQKVSGYLEAISVFAKDSFFVEEFLDNLDAASSLFSLVGSRNDNVRFRAVTVLMAFKEHHQGALMLFRASLNYLRANQHLMVDIDEETTEDHSTKDGREKGSISKPALTRDEVRRAHPSYHAGCGGATKALTLVITEDEYRLKQFDTYQSMFNEMVALRKDGNLGAQDALHAYVSLDKSERREMELMSSGPVKGVGNADELFASRTRFLSRFFISLVLIAGMIGGMALLITMFAETFDAFLQAGYLHFLWAFFFIHNLDSAFVFLPFLFKLWAARLPKLVLKDKDKEMAKVAVLILCHLSEEKIAFTIKNTRARKFQADQIFVCDHGDSKLPLDNTRQECYRASSNFETLRQSKDAKQVNYLWTSSMNKAIILQSVLPKVQELWKASHAVEEGSEQPPVPLEYVLIIDDYVLLEDSFHIPFDLFMSDPALQSLAYTVCANARSLKDHYNKMVYMPNFQDLDYKLTGYLKKVQGSFGSTTHSFAPVSFWKKDILLDVLNRNNSLDAGLALQMGLRMHQLGANHRMDTVSNYLIPVDVSDHVVCKSLADCTCHSPSLWRQAVEEEVPRQRMLFEYLKVIIQARGKNVHVVRAVLLFEVYRMLMTLPRFGIVVMLCVTQYYPPVLGLHAASIALQISILMVFNMLILQHRKDLQVSLDVILLYPYFRLFRSVVQRVFAFFYNLLWYWPWKATGADMETLAEHKELPPTSTFADDGVLSNADDIGETNADGEVEVKPEDVDRQPMQYHIAVTTSDKRGAGTDSEVYIVLFGEIQGLKVDTGRVILDDSQTHADPFERAHIDDFYREWPDLGELKRLRIGHNGAGVGAGWHLDRVVITQMATGASTTFLCDKWLDKTKKPDYAIVRDLMPMTLDSEETRVLYNVVVLTGSVPGAGTDSNVFISIFGEAGACLYRPLNNSFTNQNKFERGSRDEFRITTDQDLGELASIRIGHDGAGLGAAWHLDRVIITNEKTRQKWYFLCDKWLAKNEGDGLIVRELDALEEGDPVLMSAVTTYSVSVITGNRPGAGTDANVFINIVGSHGSVKNERLSASLTHLDKFEKGQTDNFLVVSQTDLGDLLSVEVWHDNRGINASWFLDKIIISSTVTEQTWYFFCNRYLDKNKDDGLICRELSAVPEGDERLAVMDVPYTVTIITGAKKAQSQVSNVHISLYGNNDSVVEYKLVESKSKNRHKFQVGQRDEFEVKVLYDLGDIERLKIWHCSNKQTTWNLDRVIIQNAKNRNKWFFVCDCFLERAKGDSESDPHVKEFPALKQGDPKLLTASTTYFISVYTGNIRNAGTDANVTIDLYGENGDLKGVPLKDSQNFDKFERGQRDDFVVSSGTSLGSLRGVRVAQDGKGLIDSSWYLEEIVITDENSGTRWTCVCQKWLKLDVDGGACELEAIRDGDARLAAGGVVFTVETYTGNVPRAGTNASVFLVIYGANGDSGEIKLTDSLTHFDKFERNQVDVFTCKCPTDIGDPRLIRIGHDGKGFSSGWFLDQVKVIRPDIEKEWLFPCHRWLDRGREDGQIVVNLAVEAAVAPPAPTPGGKTPRSASKTPRSGGSGSTGIPFTPGRTPGSMTFKKKHQLRGETLTPTPRRMVRTASADDEQIEPASQTALSPKPRVVITQEDETPFADDGVGVGS